MKQFSLLSVFLAILIACLILALGLNISRTIQNSEVQASQLAEIKRLRGNLENHIANEYTDRTAASILVRLARENQEYEKQLELLSTIDLGALTVTATEVDGSPGVLLYYFFESRILPDGTSRPQSDFKMVAVLFEGKTDQIVDSIYHYGWTEQSFRPNAMTTYESDGTSQTFVINGRGFELTANRKQPSE